MHKKNKNNSKQENFPFLFLMYKIDKKKIIFRNITQYELNQFTSQLQFISKRFKQHSLKNNSLCFILIQVSE